MQSFAWNVILLGLDILAVGSIYQAYLPSPHWRWFLNLLKCDWYLVVSIVGAKKLSEGTAEI